MALNVRIMATAIIVNLISFMSGISYGWSSPVLPKLKKPNSPENPLGYAISSLEEAWVAASLSLGATVGPFLCGFLVDKVGRKPTVYFTSMAIPVAYVILAFAHKVELFFLGRFILGLGIASVYGIIPMFTGEIAEKDNRGFLGCLMNVTACLGALYGLSIGPYVTIRDYCFICLAPLVLFYVLYPFIVVESPYFLVMQNRDGDAFKALKFLHRHSDQQTEKNLQEIKAGIEESSGGGSVTKNALRQWRTFLLGGALMIFQQLSGIGAVICYLQPIFEAANADLSPEISSILVGVIQVIFNCLSSQLIDRVGRKILIIVSFAGLVLSNGCLGLFFFLKNSAGLTDDVLATWNFLPVASLMGFIMFISLGVSPVVFVLVGELFAPDIKSAATTFSTFVCLGSSFLLTVFFPNFVEVVGMAVTFWMFAGCCVAGALFVHFKIPETKGKSLEEIQEMMKIPHKKEVDFKN